MKVSLHFLDRWENSIFKKYNENHIPISSFVATCVLCAAIVTVVTLFIMQMCGAQESTQETVILCVNGCAFLLTAYKLYQSVKNFPEVGTKVGYIAYILFFYAISTTIFMALATIAMMLVLIVLVLWIILMFIGGGSDDKKKKIKVHYNDGTSEEMEENGRGVCGETYYKNKDSGNTYKDI